MNKITEQIELEQARYNEIDKITKPHYKKLLKFLERMQYRFGFDDPDFHLCYTLDEDKFKELYNVLSEKNDDPDYFKVAGPLGTNMYIIKK